MSEDYNILRGFDDIVNTQNAKKEDLDSIIKALVTKDSAKQRVNNDVLDKELNDLIRNLDLSGGGINIKSEERTPLSSIRGNQGINEFLYQKSVIDNERNEKSNLSSRSYDDSKYDDRDDDKGYNDGKDDYDDYPREEFGDTKLKRMTEEKRRFDEINRVVHDIDQSKHTQRLTTHNQYGGGAQTYNNLGNQQTNYAPVPPIQNNYVQASEARKEREEFIEAITQCRAYLKECSSPALDELPEFNINDDTDKLRDISSMYKRAKANQQYNSFSNEIITFITKSVESTLNGKRKIFGRRPDATGWTRSGANVKIRRIQAQTTRSIGKFLGDNNIGSNLASFIEVAINLITYIQGKSKQDDQPDISSSKDDISSTISRMRNL